MVQFSFLPHSVCSKITNNTVTFYIVMQRLTVLDSKAESLLMIAPEANVTASVYLSILTPHS